MIHIISDPSLKRPGYIYNDMGVGYPANARPYINRRHIDGPLLVYSDGQLHWLTLWERFRYWLGWDDAESLQVKRRLDITRRAMDNVQ